MIIKIAKNENSQSTSEICCSSFSSPSSLASRQQQSLLQNVLHQAKKNRVVVICATNCYRELDSAFLRRFQQKIYVPLPSQEVRYEFVTRMLQSFSETAQLVEKKQELEEFVVATEGLTCNDLQNIITEISFYPIKELWGQKYWFFRGNTNIQDILSNI